MARVSAAEGIAYGVGLFGYLVGVLVFGLLLFIVGVGLIIESQQFILGLVIVSIGLITLYTGTAGLAYKVIADAVHKGTQKESPSKTAQKISHEGEDRKT